METTIKMGNDEFILYIRKNYKNCNTHTDVLGRQISIWFHENINDHQQLGEEPCFWGSEGEFVSSTGLPKTAMNFEFKRKYLPQLYTYLDSLGRR
jgi:hypothetical protein